MKKILLPVLLLHAATGSVMAVTRIHCTTLPMTIFTNAVTRGVPGVEGTQMLASAIGCPHDYALTPQDMRKLAGADVIVINGLGMENFLDGVIARVNPKALVIDSSKDVKGVLETCGEHNHDAQGRCTGHNHAKNEHLFAGPSTAADVVGSIAAGLSRKDPANAARYQANAKEYSAKLRKIAEEYAALGKTIPPSGRLIAVQHGIFDYLAAAAGLRVLNYLQAHTGTEPSASQIRTFIRELKAHKTALILAEKNYPSRITNLISKESGVPVLPLAVYPDDHSANPEKYLEVFENNLKALKAFYKK